MKQTTLKQTTICLRADTYQFVDEFHTKCSADPLLMNYVKNGHRDGFIGYSCVSVTIDPSTSELKPPFPPGES